MKYVILSNITHLTNSILAEALVTSNPYSVLRVRAFSQLMLYKCENEAPEGNYTVKVSDEKMFFSNDKIFGCERIDLSKVHTIIFEPSTSYASLHNGYCKEVDVLNMKEDPASNSAFILISENEGPDCWLQCIFEANTLDFGGEKVIDTIALI